MDDVILETRNLSYKYLASDQASSCCGGHRELALMEINLAIKSSTRIAILGANGAGKTTLLLHLNGGLRPMEGEILLHGKPVEYTRSAMMKWRQKVGFVFQNPDTQLFASNVYQDVSFGPMNLGLPKEEVRSRVENSLATLGIKGLAESPIHILSFGQRRRAAIAGVLAMNPEIIIFDEPTAGLDPKGVEQLLQTLDKLSLMGVTQVISTHNVNLAFSWADQVVVMGHGKILKDGDPVTVMQDDSFMRSAHLEVPMVLTMTKNILGANWVSGNGHCPRTVEELMEKLSTRTESPELTG